MVSVLRGGYTALNRKPHDAEPKQDSLGLTVTASRGWLGESKVHPVVRALPVLKRRAHFFNIFTEIALFSLKSSHFELTNNPTRGWEYPAGTVRRVFSLVRRKLVRGDGGALRTHDFEKRRRNGASDILAPKRRG